MLYFLLNIVALHGLIIIKTHTFEIPYVYSNSEILPGNFDYPFSDISFYSYDNINNCHYGQML